MLTAIPQSAIIQVRCHALAYCAWPGSKVLERITARSYSEATHGHEERSSAEAKIRLQIRRRTGAMWGILRASLPKRPLPPPLSFRKVHGSASVSWNCQISVI